MDILNIHCRLLSSALLLSPAWLPEGSQLPAAQVSASPCSSSTALSITGENTRLSAVTLSLTHSSSVLHHTRMIEVWNTGAHSFTLGIKTPLDLSNNAVFATKITFSIKKKKLALLLTLSERKTSETTTVHLTMCCCYDEIWVRFQLLLIVHSSRIHNCKPCLSQK